MQGNSALEASRSAAQIGGLGLGGTLVTVLPVPIAAAYQAAGIKLHALFQRSEFSAPESP